MHSYYTQGIFQRRGGGGGGGGANGNTWLHSTARRRVQEGLVYLKLLPWYCLILPTLATYVGVS